VSPIRSVFVMEQHIGHRTYYENLRRFVDRQPEIDATWVPITYSQPDSIWERRLRLPSNLQGTLVGRSQVRRGLELEPYDVALFNTQVPAALAGRLVRKQPYVLCMDITPVQYDQMGQHYDHKADGDGLVAHFKHRVNRRLLQGAAQILPWSTWTRSSLVADYDVDEKRVDVIPPGVDIEVWRPAARRENNELVRILFVGGDFYRKGGDTLIDAYRMLPHGIAELLLVTRSDIQPESCIRVINNMQPNSPELISLYQSCDIFVLPTKAEAFGIAAVEASAAALAIIATAVGGVTDIVKNGETGFVIKPDDTEALAQRLQRLIDDIQLRHRLGNAAREHVEEHFDAHKNAARIVNVLHAAATINGAVR